MGIFHRVWRDQPRGVPEVDPDTRGRNNPFARARTKVLALLFDRREAPLGMLVNYTLITPRDDCPIQLPQDTSTLGSIFGSKAIL